uniref:Retinol binding protein 1, cellular, tandem duplicate 1 n=1 Tax=Oncorhynchus kisutch TaxID=8019 RepID=A0A8C7MW39_ONCKI
PFLGQQGREYHTVREWGGSRLSSTNHFLPFRSVPGGGWDCVYSERRLWQAGPGIGQAPHRHGKAGTAELILDVNVAIRKIATLLKPDKDINHDGDHIVIKTLSTFKNYNMDFHVGKEFEEDLSGVDDRKCMTTISWEGDNLVCVQKGEKEGRGWTHWVEGDELHLELRACGAVCKQVFKKT